MSLYPLSNTWDTKYVTVSNTWAIKDTVTSYLTKYTLCSAVEPYVTLGMPHIGNPSVSQIEI